MHPSVSIHTLCQTLCDCPFPVDILFCRLYYSRSFPISLTVLSCLFWWIPFLAPLYKCGRLNLDLFCGLPRPPLALLSSHLRQLCSPVLRWGWGAHKSFTQSLSPAPGEGNGTPLQYSCLENPMDRGAWKAAVHGVAEGWARLSDFTFTFHFSLSCIGEGNGNPPQCSCLENPRDGGAWWAAVYGVAQSWTRLK